MALGLYDETADVLLHNVANLATGPALDSFLIHNRNMFVCATNRIINDLMDHYDYAPGSFPKDAASESAAQQSERATLVSTWAEDLVWEATELQRFNTLTLLFYSIWSLRYFSGESGKKRPGYSAGRTGRPFGKPSQIAASNVLINHRTSLSPLGDIDSLALLREGLQSLKQLEVPKYTRLLDNVDTTVRNLAQFVRPDIIRLLRKESISRESLTGVGGDVSVSRPGIYVHLLWPSTFDQYDFYVYVGQSNNLRQRIEAHSDIWYRHKHPSLHYHVWDSQPDMNSNFIVFSYADNATETELNLLEFWACLILQSLPATESSKYVTSQNSRLGRELNVSNPLWQGTPGHLSVEPLERRDRFATLMRSPDPTIREYYRSLSRAFTNLQHSSDIEFRAYFASLCLRRQAAGSATKTARTLCSLIAGSTRDVVVYAKTSRLVIIGNLTIRLLKKYVTASVQPGMQVHVQGFLSIDARADCYAKDAMQSDPANRLGLKVTYNDAEGNSHSSFIRAGGNMTVRDVNTLVDQLDGVEDIDIAQRPRRRIPLTVCSGQKQYSS